jgi:hypothetical protein
MAEKKLPTVLKDFYSQFAENHNHRKQLILILEGDMGA